MQFRTITGLTQPEIAFGQFVNKSGTTSAVGNVYQHDIATLKDGKAVIRPTTAGLSAVVGAAMEAGRQDGDSILIGTYGLIPTLVKGKVGSGGNTVAGDILVPVNAEYNLVFSAASTGTGGFAISMETTIAQDAAAALKNVLWRGL